MTNNPSAKTLLIIGAGTEQVPAYQLAQKRGLTVVGTDISPEAPALEYADHTLIASTRDPQATLKAVNTFHQDHPINGVMTIANDVPYTVATVAHALGLPGISLESALYASHKLKMKEQFKANAVACPWFTSVNSIDHLKELIHSQPGKRFVLKPIDGRGARGVLLLNHNSDLDWAYHESKRWGDSGELMLETFIPGLQLSTESFILDSKCYTAAISERNYARLEEFSPYIIEDGGTIPATLSFEQHQAIDELLLQGAKAMGITQGLVKGDLVINSEGQPMIIELAARLSGGWFATHQIPAATGINLVDVVMSHALGEPISTKQLQPTKNKATATRYWFPPVGRIQSIEGESQLKETPGLIQYGFFRQPNDEQPPIYSHPDRFGYVIVEGQDREEALDRIHQALNSIQIDVQTGKMVACADKLTGC